MRILTVRWAGGIPGYGDARTDGRYAIAVPNGVQTNLGLIPPPPGGPAGYVRLPSAGLNIACVGQRDGFAYEWNSKTGWEKRIGAYKTGQAFGMNGVIYDHFDKLVIADGSKEIGSQGWRFVGQNGALVPAQATYADIPNGIFEYTEYGDVRIGQGPETGAVVHFPFRDKNGKLVMDKRWLVYGELTPKHAARNIRVNRTGDNFAITVVCYAEHVTFVVYATLAELKALPTFQETKPVPNPPSPKPEASVLPTEKDALAIVTEATKKYSTQKGRLRAYLIVNYVAWKLKAFGAGVYSKGKSGDGFDPPNDGVNEIISSDAIIFKPNWETFDCLGDAENRAKPAWDRTTPTGFGKQENWRAPVDPDLLSVLAGLPQPEPEPQPEVPPAGELTVSSFSATATKDGRIVLKYTV